MIHKMNYVLPQRVMSVTIFSSSLFVNTYIPNRRCRRRRRRHFIEVAKKPFSCLSFVLFMLKPENNINAVQCRSITKGQEKKYIFLSSIEQYVQVQPTEKKSVSFFGPRVSNCFQISVIASSPIPAAKTQGEYAYTIIHDKNVAAFVQILRKKESIFIS